MGVQADKMMKGMRASPREERFRYISERARPYPSYLLKECKTGLGLFAAGFLGWNDCVHFARAGMMCECVDTNAERLWEMATIYPEGWAFHVEDAWSFAGRALEQGRSWDVVSADPFFGDAAETAWQSLRTWAPLARKLITLTVKPDMNLRLPLGWTASYFPRNDRAGWMVLRHA